jgi:hypothetical protein
VSIYARIQDGAVAELFTPWPGSPPMDQMFPPELIWVDCTALPDVQPGWLYDGTTFTPPPPIVLTPDQELAARIAQGIVITSTATSALNATYALDKDTMDQIGPVARDSCTRLGLPGKVSTFDYPDITGKLHAFTATDLQNLYMEQRDMLLILNTQAGIMAHGLVPAWPAQSATIA